jgi:hypothetical protein
MEIKFLSFNKVSDYDGINPNWELVYSENGIIVEEQIFLDDLIPCLNHLMEEK